MLIKWICCTVPNFQRQAFSDAQIGWSELAIVPGFVAQVGGWDSRRAESACILGVWRDRLAYDSFMNLHHDKIYERRSQRSFYSTIETSVFEENRIISNNRWRLIDLIAKADVIDVMIYEYTTGGLSVRLVAIDPIPLDCEPSVVDQAPLRSNPEMVKQSTIICEKEWCVLAADDRR